MGKLKVGNSWSNELFVDDDVVAVDDVVDSSNFK